MKRIRDIVEKRIKTKTIRQSAVFDAKPHEVYELLMDSKKHADFSKAGAKISKQVGGKFTAYDDWISGKNLELVKDRKIVQLWRGDDWPKEHYSVVTFKLSKKGNMTRLDFIQTGVPEDKYKEISAGWKEFYWEKMKEFLE